MLRALVAALLLAVPTFAHSLTIRDDQGGDISEYLERAARYAQEGEQIRINGECVSACIVFLMKSHGLGVCATPRARLGFHMPYAVNRHDRLVKAPVYEKHSSEVAQAIVADLPPILQAAFAIETLPSVYKGDHRSKMAWVTGRDAQQAIGACE